MMNPIENRRFLRANWESPGKDTPQTDQQKGVPRPAPEKPFDEGSPIMNLVEPAQFRIGDASVRDVIGNRRSRRQFGDQALTLEELSFLLWATQGVRDVEPASDGVVTWRTVPSAGCRHSFETYLVVNRVQSVEGGLYRYLPIEHKLLRISVGDYAARVSKASRGQNFVGEGAVVFIWSAIPYRMEWRYSTRAAKSIALDAGHVCQNLYVAAEAIGAGTCAIAAYFQDQMDALIGVDGEEEFVIYAAPVGKPK